MGISCLALQASSNQEAGEEGNSPGGGDISSIQRLVRDADNVLSCLRSTHCHKLSVWHSATETHCLALQASSNQEAGEEASSPDDSDSSTVQPLVRDADNVLSCLKRALKIANAAQQQLAVALKASDTAPAFLYVEILNQYLYYFEQGLPNITSSVIQVRLSALISLSRSCVVLLLLSFLTGHTHEGDDSALSHVFVRAGMCVKVNVCVCVCVCVCFLVCGSCWYVPVAACLAASVLSAFRRSLAWPLSLPVMPDSSHCHYEQREGSVPPVFNSARIHSILTHNLFCTVVATLTLYATYSRHVETSYLLLYYCLSKPCCTFFL